MTDAGGGNGAGSFLGVERSAGGRRWRQREGAAGAAEAIAERYALPEILGRLLAGRRIELDEVPLFLKPRLRDQLPDPCRLRDMNEAVARLVRAVEGGETIAVFGDYDVDGATSAALLLRFFAAIGTSCRLYVPDRLREGYGPNASALLRLHAEGTSIVVTVDCGTAAHEALEAAAEAGLDVIVLDHHMSGARLPPAVAVVNPNRLDEETPHRFLAAVGVAFLFLVALNRALREAGWYGAGREEPDLLSWLDLVALGTVCDVVPLLGLNRALVAQGLKVVRRGENRGLAALASVAAVAGPLDAYHLGFVLGPRVNAGGRVGEAALGARLLAADDPALAAELARRLDDYNRERREIEGKVLESAIAVVESGEQAPTLAFAAGKGWHPGVIGIVASRLKERYGRPACVVAIEGAIGKGSGRSIEGLALGPAVIAAREEGLLIDGGGHAMAAGFTVAADKIAALRAFLAERLGAGAKREALRAQLSIDAPLSPSAASGELLERIEALAPFGAGNPEPRFVFPAVRIHSWAVVGTDHLRLSFGDPLEKGRLEAIAFRAMGSDLGRFLRESRGVAVHLVGRLRRARGGGLGVSSARLRFQTEAPLCDAHIQAIRRRGKDERPMTLYPALPTPDEEDILLVVDIQNDFCPGGALAVPEGDSIIPLINRLASRFTHVGLTQDWHPKGHLSFASSHPGRRPFETMEVSYGPQILWPDHCVQETSGAAFHPALGVPHAQFVLRKGYHRAIDSYSAFRENDRQTRTGLASYLRERGFSRLTLCGLATDFCVLYSALDALADGFSVSVVVNASRGIDIEGSLDKALASMREAGASLFDATI